MFETKEELITRYAYQCRGTRPTFEVIGFFIPVDDTLFLTRISCCGIEAYPLLSEDQYLRHCQSQPPLPSRKVLDKRRRWLHQGKYLLQSDPKKVLDVASDVTYGLCVCPPHWGVIEYDASYMSDRMISNGLFSAVVEVEWESGEITWEIVAKSVALISKYLYRTLNKLGQRNEKKFRMITTAYYIAAHSHNAE
jgi:hypothetical protein